MKYLVSALLSISGILLGVLGLWLAKHRTRRGP
jgi:hypothetical protein